MKTSQIVLLVLFALIAIIAAANWERVRWGWGKLREFAGEVRQEVRKVSWPTRDQVIGSTLMVGVLTLALMFIIGGVDLFFGKLVGLIFSVRQ